MTLRFCPSWTNSKSELFSKLKNTLSTFAVVDSFNLLSSGCVYIYYTAVDEIMYCKEANV